MLCVITSEGMMSHQKPIGRVRLVRVYYRVVIFYRHCTATEQAFLRLTTRHPAAKVLYRVCNYGEGSWQADRLLHKVRWQFLFFDSTTS